MLSDKEYHEKRQAETTNALQILKANGYEPVLKNWQTGQINVKSKRGVGYTYYSHTGTIVGYGYTHINGIDDLLRLLSDV